ncbi:hypothetical protein [Flavobacterium sp.]|uniref:hypothetical protein n=1 Tax=Flavobacterium sp. TaxID=239 RepID=UPI0037509008
MAVFEPEKSKIKMVILTKENAKNVVWYSPIKQNRRRSDLIIKSMLKRFKNHDLYWTTNVIQCYENNVLIFSEKIQFQ